MRLNALFQPTLVADGDSDILMPPRNSHLPAEHLPDIQLHIYPNSGHGGTLPALGLPKRQYW